MTNILLLLIFIGIATLGYFAYRISTILRDSIKVFENIYYAIDSSDPIEKTIISEPGEKDELFDTAKEIILQSDYASASLLQRKMTIGYARAARIMDEFVSEGIVEPAKGARPRKVLKQDEK